LFTLIDSQFSAIAASNKKHGGDEKNSFQLQKAGSGFRC